MSFLNKVYGILIVEDDKVTRTIMSKFLESQGFAVKSESTAGEAFKAIDGDIDLVIVDIGLPDFDGQHLVVRIRRRFDKNRLKICFVSSSKEEESIRKSIAVGGDDYLIKPVEKDLLIHKVTKLLGNLSSQFAWVGAECSAKILNSDILPELKVLRINELGLFIKSSAEMVVGAHIKVTCNTLSKAIELSIDDVIQRVVSCEKIRDALYYVTTEFVGITEKLAQPLRALAVRGKFLTDK